MIASEGMTTAEILAEKAAREGLRRMAEARLRQAVDDGQEWAIRYALESTKEVTGWKPTYYTRPLRVNGKPPGEEVL